VSAAEQVAKAEEALQAVKTELAQCSQDVSAQEKAMQSALVAETMATEKLRHIEQAKCELRSMTEQDVIMPPSSSVPLEITAPAKSGDLTSIALVSPESINVGGC